jgi:hypothetical protein
MSVTSTLDTLAQAFTNLQNPGYPTWGAQYLTVLKRPTDRINAEDFPLLVIGYDWNKDHHFELHQGGGGHHLYWLAIYVFVGGKVAELDELHRRIEPWPLLLINPVLAWIQGNGIGVAVPVGEGTQFMPYRVGYFPWGGPNDYYFGLKTELLINEDEDE